MAATAEEQPFLSTMGTYQTGGDIEEPHGNDRYATNTPQKVEDDEVDWTDTFDYFIFWFMVGWFVVMLVLTYFVHPTMYTQPARFYSFWGRQFFKLFAMGVVAYIGGTIVLTFNVKVNYTRKIQHFCAYLVPLIFTSAGTDFARSLHDEFVIMWWGYFFTLLSFAIFIYPIRTRLNFINTMYTSLDRPEDEGHTLKWITTQIFIGYIILCAFIMYFEYTGQARTRALVFIPVLITGIGDGLAEPVGIAWGKHKYKTRGLCTDRAYTRSYEGSACVFIVGVLSCILFYSTFASPLHFWVAIATIPIALTFAEAFSPHTWDTPFLLGSGCIMLWAINYIPVSTQ